MPLTGAHLLRYHKRYKDSSLYSASSCLASKAGGGCGTWNDCKQRTTNKTKKTHTQHRTPNTTSKIVLCLQNLPSPCSCHHHKPDDFLLFCEAALLILAACWARSIVFSFKAPRSVCFNHRKGGTGRCWVGGGIRRTVARGSQNEQSHDS